MSKDANKALMFEIGDALFRSWWTLVAAVCFGVAAALVALHFIPSVYEATAKVRVAPQAIPEAMVQSTVTDTMAERLAEVRESILGRSYMLDLMAKHFTVPEDEANQDRIIRALRSRVTVDTIRGSRLFLLSYRDNDRQRAADVANSLTDLYVRQNSEYRRSEAEQTRTMFAEQAEQAGLEFQEIEREYTEFNLANRNKSEAYLDLNMQQIKDLRRDIEANTMNQRTVQQRIDDLQLQIDQGDWAVAVVDGVVLDPAAQRVTQLEQELAQLLLSLTDQHPDVEAKRHELQRAIEARAAGGSRGSGTGSAARVEPALAALQSRVSAATRELTNLKEIERRLRREVTTVRTRVDRTSEIQTRLNELEERREAAKLRFESLKEKSELAREGVDLEVADRGERLEVVEWAVAPFRPVSPDPFTLYPLCIVAGLLLFIGPLLARRILNPIVSSEAGLRAVVEVPVLVSIPRVTTVDNEQVRRRQLLLNLGFSSAFLGLLAAVLTWMR